MNAMITGASKGIGRAIALEIAPKAKTLFLVARTAAMLDEIGGLASDANPNVTIETHAIDVTDEAAVVRMFSDVGARHSHLDALVNCAGRCTVRWASGTRSQSSR